MSSRGARLLRALGAWALASQWVVRGSPTVPGCEPARGSIHRTYIPFEKPRPRAACRTLHGVGVPTAGVGAALGLHGHGTRQAFLRVQHHTLGHRVVSALTRPRGWEVTVR